MSMTEPSPIAPTATLPLEAGGYLAWRSLPGSAGAPTFVWLSGFRSDMTGGKACAVEAWAQAQGQGFLAFDYRGHGQSSGLFAGCTLTTWREDTLTALDQLSKGPLVLVGSSMGGWLALLAALARPERVAALLLIAPAPDFTERLMWPSLAPALQQAVLREGQVSVPSDYGEPLIITRRLIEEGRRWLLLDAPIPFAGPVRILQGMHDADVPWQHAGRIVDTLESEDVVLSLIKDGDHRLSRPQDIQRLLGACAELSSMISPGGA